MAGLESIALAVAHLERENSGNEVSMKREDRPSRSPPISHLVPTPQRHGLGGGPSATRLVSAEYHHPMAYAYSGHHHTSSPSPVSSMESHPHHHHHYGHLGQQPTSAFAYATEYSGPRNTAASVSPPSGCSAGPTPQAVPSTHHHAPAQPEQQAPQSAVPLETKSVASSGVTVTANGEVDLDALDRLLADSVMAELEGKMPPTFLSPVPMNPPAPDQEIHTVNAMDVLCGRGGETNHHSGNIQYRQLVKICQPAYIAAKRREKPKIAQSIVKTVRRLGGRFLKKDSSTNSWRDVGNTKAREKTSQALREGAPELRHGQSSGSVSPSSSKAPKASPAVSSSGATPHARRVSGPTTTAPHANMHWQTVSASPKKRRVSNVQTVVVHHRPPSAQPVAHASHPAALMPAQRAYAPHQHAVHHHHHHHHMMSVQNPHHHHPHPHYPPPPPPPPQGHPQMSPVSFTATVSADDDDSHQSVRSGSVVVYQTMTPPPPAQPSYGPPVPAPQQPPVAHASAHAPPAPAPMKRMPQQAPVPPKTREETKETPPRSPTKTRGPRIKLLKRRLEETNN